MTVYGIPGLFQESVSATTSTNTVDVGTLRFETGKLWKYVYFETSGTIGYACQYTSGGSGTSVVVGSGAVGDPIAGVIQNTTATTAKYGWMLCKGIGTLVAGSSVSSNSPFGVLAAGTFGSLKVMASGTYTATVGYQAVGMALQSAVTTTAGTTFLGAVNGTY